MAEAATVAALFTAVAAESAGTLALVSETAQITYGEAAVQGTGLAKTLMAAGVAAGDRVAVWLPNGAEWLVAHWAVANCGAILVPINTRYRPAEVHYLLSQAEVSALIMCDRLLRIDFLAALAELRAMGLPHLKAVVVTAAPDTPLPADVLRWGDAIRGTDAIDDEMVARRRAAISPEDTHLIQYTSGSTGFPKGAMLTHAALIRGANSRARLFDLRPNQGLFVPNPMSHIMGTTLGRLVPAAARATAVTMAIFSVETALHLMSAYRVVGMAGTPSHYQMLIDYPGLDQFDLTTLKVALVGGANMTPEQARNFKERLGLAALINGLGLTEATGGISFTQPDDPPEVTASTIGILAPWLEGRIVDPETGHDQPVGEAGELWIRGPGLMTGYFRQPEETAKALTADGWLRTGDLVRADANGYMYYAGRLKEMFTVGGFNVYPAEVERVLSGHPAVAECQVVAVAEPRLGEVPFAFVRLRPGSDGTESDLISFCKQRLASYKVPRFVHFIGSFPLAPTGKVAKSQLREAAIRIAGERSVS